MRQDTAFEHRVQLLPQRRARPGIEQLQQSRNLGRVHGRQQLAHALVLAVCERLNDLFVVSA